MTEVTRLLESIAAGDADAADRLLPLVYADLREVADRLFRGQPRGHTLQPTALVHEAWMRLARADASYADRTHFVAVAARAMRQILVDHARRRGAQKRGGDARRVTIAEPAAPEGLAQIDVVALDAALADLAEVDPRQARIVELRFFGGLDVAETAEALGVSPRTVELDWRMAKAWLSRELA